MCAVSVPGIVRGPNTKYRTIIKTGGGEIKEAGPDRLQDGHCRSSPGFFRDLTIFKLTNQEDSDQCLSDQRSIGGDQLLAVILGFSIRDARWQDM